MTLRNSETLPQEHVSEEINISELDEYSGYSDTKCSSSTLKIIS